MLDITTVSSGTQPKLAPPHARHCTPNASAFSCGRVIAQSLKSNCPGAAQLVKTAAHIGVIAFIHRLGSSLNGHVHFHACVVDGVFEEVPGDTDAQSSPPGVIFHLASAIDETAVAQVQTDLRRRILRAFV